MLKNLGTLSYILSREITNNIFEGKDISNSNFIKFSTIIAESDVLSKEYLVYKNIESKYIKDDMLASRYIDENISIFNNIKYSDYVNENKKLDIFSYDNIPDNKRNLFESIQTLITESTIKRGVKAVDKIHDSFEIVLEYIKNNKNETISEETTFDIEPEFIETLYTKSIDIFNEKYKNLNEYEIKIINSIDNDNQMEHVFIEIVNEAKNKIEVLKEKENDVEVLTKLNLVKEKLDNFKFNKDNYLNDVVKVFELYSCL